MSSGKVSPIAGKRWLKFQVDYYTVDGTAKEGKDYFKKAGTLTFGPNMTRLLKDWFLVYKLQLDLSLLVICHYH